MHTNHYNSKACFDGTHYGAVGSLEVRVLSGLRKFEALKTAPERESLPSPEPVEAQPRELTSAELRPSGEDGSNKA